MRTGLRVLVPALGLLTAVAGAVLVTEVLVAWVRGVGPGDPGVLVPWPAWRDLAGRWAWQDAGPLIACAAVALLGLALLAAAGTSGRRGIRLRDPATDVSVIAGPRVLARLVGQRVRAGEGVSAG
jgi:hypothetical protein